ncbi:MAG: glycosyltransferase [Chloroflexi bacterium]|nr:glycosyltransferase [Chloroflexota bacterium]
MRTVLVLPVYNEADNLGPLLERIDQVRNGAALDLDVLAVDDGSVDASYDELTHLMARFPYLSVVRHGQNRGFAAALRTGFKEGLARGYGALALMDADLTHDPAELPALLGALEQGADVAIGSRYVPGGGMESVPFLRAAISRVGNLVGRLVLNVPVADLTSGYRAFRRSVLEQVVLEERGFGIQLETVTRAHRAGFRLAEAPITLRVRKHGYSKMVYNLSFWWSYARLLGRLAVGRGGRGDAGTRRRGEALPASPRPRVPASARISVVVTVLNEGASIDTLLASLAAQARPPDEVVVVDGGSVDETQARLAAWRDRLPLQVIVLPGANISQGRNVGIAAASGSVIAVTDAGVRLSERWLAELVAPFEAPEPPEVAAGFFHAEPCTVFEVAMGATVLPLRQEIDPQRFLPSSRSVAFTREAWKKVGGYPEWLDYCEDLVFDLRLKQLGCRFAWAPEALAYYRPRASLSAFFRQYYCYARGDGKAGLWPWRHVARYATYLGAPWALLLARQTPLAALVLGVGAAIYLRRPYARLLPQLATLRWPQAARALALVPVIRVVGDVAKMAGYPVGLWWRWRSHSGRG